MSELYDRGLVEDFARWRQFSPGMWAWIFHKFTGWVLIGYLFTHIAVLSAAIPAAGGDPSAIAAGEDVYTTTLQGLESLLVVRVLEIGLLAVAVFHIINGVRLLMIDLGLGLASQDRSFYVALVVTGAIAVASVPTFLGGGVV